MSEYLHIENLIYKEKNYEQALAVIEVSDSAQAPEFKLLKANALFYKNELEAAAKIYCEIGELYRLGYCYFLLNEIDTAVDVWKKSPNTPARNWSLFFAEIFRGRLNCSPTYLQVRAFLERDLNNFLKPNV